ncbi:class III signal peptide-containing protein [Methanothermococcus sp.]|uniref:class III signal peptide-containing protein n=1 Tax=Methanothermococcus sp. TaxID=2614238 RepID=UPI0025ED9A68|nr:class III signal peptide-containing protein [Methanothermococcus sp.]
MRGQISLEFSILFLALLVVVIVSTMTSGMYGYKKTVEVSSASLGHAALSKLKTNIDMLSVADSGSKKLVYIKSPPGIWVVNGTNITLKGNGYNLTTTCSINLTTNEIYKTNLSVDAVLLERNKNNIYINWS